MVSSVKALKPMLQGTFSLQSELRGAGFFKGTAIRRIKTAGEYLVLVPEPDNPVDKNAIIARTMLGEPVAYVAREHAPVIAGLLACGVELQAVTWQKPAIMIWVHNPYKEK